MSNMKLDPEDVGLIQALRADGMMLKEIAAKFEITTAHVSKIVKGKTWKHLVVQENEEEFPKCACGENALIIEKGVAECGACWARPKRRKV